MTALTDAMQRINRLLQAGSYRAAHDQLAEIVAANPGYAEALRLLAGAKQALGATGDADSGAADTVGAGRARGARFRACPRG